MITLPDNWQEYVLVNTHNNTLLLYLKNSADQYFTYYQQLDKAFSLDDNLDKIGQRDFSTTQVYEANPDNLHFRLANATAQDWKPVPIPLDDVVPLAQYRETQNA